MNFLFNIDQMEDNEINIIPEFCDFLLDNIKSDIANNLSFKRFNRYEKYLLNTSLINWKIKRPEHLNVIKLCELIISSFKCYELKNNLYSIKIDRSKFLRGTKTRLSLIARLLDKGNEEIPGTLFISLVLNKYSKNINNVWKRFVLNKLGRVKVSKCIKII